MPFCAHKCEYCAFYSEAANGEVINRYVSALIREMELVSAEGFSNPNTVFFGGGTPSLLNLRQWEKVLDAMARLNLTGAAEWTVECNPATVSLDKARLLRERGVNRVSMGVQSLDEKLLDRLGRVHSREMALRSFETLRQTGFSSLNIDLMFAIPGQTLEVWRDTLNEAIALGSEHLSCYEVIYEEDTPLFAQLQAGEFDVNDELACDMYDELIDVAVAHGFTQYEVANFARGGDAALEVPSHACRHNINYWRAGPCVALGPSATGYNNGCRTKNISNTPLYCELIEGGRRPVESAETLSPLARAGETAAFGLRMNQGWPYTPFKEVTGYDLRSEWRAEINRLTGLGYGVETSDRFHLTRQGLRYADWAAELFLR